MGYNVSGDTAVEAAALGECSLQSSLASGEALCDLVNAIWPGKIVGIHRGEKALRLPPRIANISLFVKACASVGIDKSSLFLPIDLAEGKNMKSVIRCIQ